MKIKASELKTGMKFWDGCTITVKSQTKCYIICDLTGGELKPGHSVECKWNKNSMIILEA